MKKLLQVGLGIVTSIGGFLEIGSITTAAQAGAAFRYQLVWAVLLGTICVLLLVEMSGRFAAVGRHTISDAMRERFGLHFFLVPLILLFLISVIVLGAEIGGVCIALEMLSGMPLRAWAIPAALALWALLWYGTFGLIENGVSLLGLISVAFVVAAIEIGPDYHHIAAGLLPSLPHTEPARYWFLAVSIIGASVSPYLFYFYSSGAIEEKWDESFLGANRAIAAIGMGFGGFLSIAVLVVAALVFAPRGIQVEHYDQLGLLLSAPLGRAGFLLLAASLLITCLGASLEIALALAYQIAQGFGWNWGEDLTPGSDARFSLTYSLILFGAMLFVLIGLDPLQLTVLSMALTAASLPVAIVPFLVLMNDRDYLHEHTNGRVANLAVLLISILSGVLAVVSIPLQYFGS